MHLSKIWRKKGVNHASVQWLSAEGNLEASSSFILFKELAGTSVPGLEKIKWSVRRDEDNGDLLQKIPCMYRYTQCPQSCRRPAQTHTSTGDSWTLTGKTGSVSCGVTVPSSRSWCTRFCLSPPRVYFPALCKFCQLYVGLMVTSSKRAYVIPSLLHPAPLSLWQCTADPYLYRRHSNTVLSQSLWGPWVLVHTRFVWALWASLVGMGFDKKCEFAPPTILLGFLLCPWTWGISSQPLQHLLSYWCFSDLNICYLLMAGPAKHRSCSWP